MCKPCLIIALVFALSVAGAVFLLWRDALAQAPPVVINEIAWMGSTNSHTDEWIELRNPTQSPVDLTGWRLEAADGTPLITLAGTIAASGYFLLERTDDTSTPASADQIYTGALGNSGETFTLFDTNGVVIDSVSGWLAGNNTTKETMARSESGGWVNGPVGGTPKMANGTAQMVNGEDEAPDENPDNNPEAVGEKTDTNAPQQAPEEENATPPPPPVKTKDIIINEFLPDPTGSDAESEWLELFNKGAESYDIGGWKLDDIEGASSPFTLAQGTVIAPGGYLVFSRPTTHLALNNEGDTVRLLYSDGTVAYETIYDKAPEGSSYALLDGAWDWTSVLTPGSANIANASPPAPKAASTPIKKSKEDTPAPKVEEPDAEENLSPEQFSAKIARESPPFPLIFLFAAAALVSASIGTAFVIFKKRLT